MDKASFLAEVELMSGLRRTEAERAVRATLETLAERLSAGVAGALPRALPPELRPYLVTSRGSPEPFSLDEFVRRVSHREGVDIRAARHHVLGVFAALGAVVSDGDVRTVAAELPGEFAPLLAAATETARNERQAEVDPFVLRVAELAGVDEHLALRATEAVLEALAARISPREAHDLMPELPARLTPALERGLLESWQPRALSPGEFVALVADREGVSKADATRDVRAVFTALRETVGGGEFAEIAAELGDDYELLLLGAG